MENLEPGLLTFLNGVSSLHADVADLKGLVLFRVPQSDAQVVLMPQLKSVSEKLTSLECQLSSISSLLDAEEKYLGQTEQLKSMMAAQHKIIAKMSSRVPHVVNGNDVSDAIVAPVVKQRSEGDNKQKAPSKTAVLDTATAAKPASSGRACKIEKFEKDEFNTVPQYMRGRCTADQFNSAISDLNVFLSNKYRILEHSKPTKLKAEEQRLWSEYKELENDETVGKIWYMPEDTKEMTTVKSLSKYFVQVMRHTKRLTELRSAGSIRYVLCNPVH